MYLLHTGLSSRFEQSFEQRNGIDLAISCAIRGEHYYTLLDAASETRCE